MTKGSKEMKVVTEASPYALSDHGENLRAERDSARKRKQELEAIHMKQLWYMASASLNPEDFEKFEFLLTKLANRRHLDWEPRRRD